MAVITGTGSDAAAITETGSGATAILCTGSGAGINGFGSAESIRVAIIRLEGIEICDGTSSAAAVFFFFFIILKKCDCRFF